MAARQPDIAHAVCDAADIFKVPLLGMINTLHESVYTERGHGFMAEYYADLDYSDDGFVIIKRQYDWKDAAEAAKRAVEAIKTSTTVSVNGKSVPVRADTICVHSDSPNAVAIATAVRDAIKPYMTAA